MTYPQGAVETEEELLQLGRNGTGKVYTVVAWDKFEIVTADAVSIGDTHTEAPGKWRVTIGRESWWLWKGEARVPPGAPYVELKPRPEDCTYTFTNYWWAYAYWLKMKSRS